MGVADRVVDDVAEQPLQVVGVADGSRAGCRVEVDVEVDMVGLGAGGNVPKEYAHIHPPLLSR
jgi:hypothetical protein